MLPKLLRRQELERMEEERGIRIFLTPEEAVVALRSLSREVAGLTYGWASPDHPDVTGEYLANVRRFLRDPLGEQFLQIIAERVDPVLGKRDARRHRMAAARDEQAVRPSRRGVPARPATACDRAAR